MKSPGDAAGSRLAKARSRSWEPRWRPRGGRNQSWLPGRRVVNKERARPLHPRGRRVDDDAHPSAHDPVTARARSGGARSGSLRPGGGLRTRGPLPPDSAAQLIGRLPGRPGFTRGACGGPALHYMSKMQTVNELLLSLHVERACDATVGPLRDVAPSSDLEIHRRQAEELERARVYYADAKDAEAVIHEPEYLALIAAGAKVE